MSQPVNPSEIAREALRRLASQRELPTPDNYRRLYHEIAGTTDNEEQLPVRFVRQLLPALPRNTAEQQRFSRSLEQALSNGDARGGRKLLEQWLSSFASANNDNPAWNELIPTLLRQWEARQNGWTTARKRDSLERVLGANDSATLFTRLQGLLRAWGQAANESFESAPETTTEAAQPSSATASPSATTPLATQSAVTVAAAVTAPPPAVSILRAGETDEYLEELRELLFFALESVIPAQLAEQEPLADESRRIAAGVRQAQKPAQLQALKKPLRDFSWRLEMAAGEIAEVRSGLLDLLRLLLANIDQLVLDDQWLHGQVEVLREVVDKPATLPMIDDAGRRLKEVIYKQSQLKHTLSEAQRALREMLAGFVDQLASFADTTGSYHDHISVCAQKITKARDIAEISHVLDDVMRETRNIQQEAARSRDELSAARDRAREAEEKIASLQHQLDETSRLMRHDQLTGALNRRGLEELFEQESGRAQRRRAPLGFALLDIDNFKKLNDTFGHQTGDDALVHLTQIVRDNLRPQDSVARFGGEEFIILYPDTDLEQGTAALVRLQRALTKNFFLAGNQKIFITFSGGITLYEPGEHLESVMQRADRAMYEAKQTGKNRVVAIPSQLSASVAPADGPAPS